MLGENCPVSVQRDCNLENKRRTDVKTDVKIGVVATLPEFSELTLTVVVVCTEKILSAVFWFFNPFFFLGGGGRQNGSSPFTPVLQVTSS